MLVSRFTDGDEEQLMEHIREAQWVADVEAGDLAELRRCLELNGSSTRLCDLVKAIVTRAVLTFNRLMCLVKH